LLAADIESFAKAQTKSQKSRWFKDRGFSELSFLSTITLPDGAEAFSPGPLRRMYPLPKIKVELPNEVSRFFTNFLVQWLSSSDDERLLSEFIDSARIAANAGLEKIADSRTVSVTVLRMWQIRDHGLVTVFGHADPRESFGGFKALATSVAKANYSTFGDPADALVSFGDATGPQFIVAPKTGSSGVPGVQPAEYTLLLRFLHAPYDVVAVGAARIENRWRIVSVHWAVEY